MIQTRRRRTTEQIARAKRWRRARAGDRRALRFIFLREHVIRINGFDLEKMFGGRWSTERVIREKLARLE